MGMLKNTQEMNRLFSSIVRKNRMRSACVKKWDTIQAGGFQPGFQGSLHPVV